MKPEQKDLQSGVIDIAIRLGALGLLAAACFWILAPFLMAVAWGAIIAIAVYPVFLWIVGGFGGRSTAAAVVVTLLLLASLIVPSVMLAGSLVGGAQLLADEAQAGSLAVPPPPDGVASWPIIGEQLHRVWAQASMNLEAVLQQFTPQIREAATWVLSTAAGTGFTLVQFLLSIVIAGVLLSRDAHAAEAARQFMSRLAGKQGPEYAAIAARTVQSVTRGILGVALIQAVLAGLGFLVAGVPAAGLLTLVCLIVGVVQLPIALVTIPVAVYVVSTAGTLESVLFVGWNILVTPADNVLKPILLGRGAPVPTIVIFLGAIGGFMGAGLIGLFVGAVVLSLGFVLYERWLEQTDTSQPRTQPPLGF
ncbi:MAG: AI-2E family transporter [Candidatus Binatia bacterium]|nr:AI-2E family transporter [Candidatus Binatia bacterium]